MFGREPLSETHRFAVHLAGTGSSESQVRAVLLNRGLGPARAGQVAGDAMRARKSAARRAAGKHIFLGGIVFLLGAAGTVVLHELLGGPVACIVPLAVAGIGLVELLRGCCLALRGW